MKCFTKAAIFSSFSAPCNKTTPDSFMTSEFDAELELSSSSADVFAKKDFISDSNFSSSVPVFFCDGSTRGKIRFLLMLCGDPPDPTMSEILM